jgi:lipopolysaccharide transport system ATP-binding protein
MAPIIEIRNISKKFERRVSGQSQYQTLRETLTNGLKNLFKKSTGQLSQDFWALKDVSFTVEPGDVVGLIGRNGAGKSTLLKVLSRIIAPTSGEIILRGRVSSLLEVGTGFHPELTGRENIYMNGAILGMSQQEIRSKFDEIVAFAGVGDFIDTPVKRYSSGMYMRLAFSVAAHIDPEILIVDEVLAVGDAEFQKKCLGKMRDVSQSGRTVIFVSHNINAIQDLCNKIVWLDKGQVLEAGNDVRTITSHYVHGKGSMDTLWENPEPDNMFRNRNFTPLSMSLTNGQGELVTDAVQGNDEVYITITGNIETIDPALTMGYAIFNEDNQLLYWSYFTDLAESEWPEVRTGKNTYRSQLPRRLLNEGKYTIELICSLHFREWIFKPGETSIRISFMLQGGLSDSPMWRNRRDGVIAPALKWSRIDE